MKNETNSNVVKLPAYKTIKKADLSDVLNNKWIKVALIGVGIVAFVGVSGYILKVFSFTLAEFKGLKEVIKS